MKKIIKKIIILLVVLTTLLFSIISYMDFNHVNATEINGDYNMITDIDVSALPTGITAHDPQTYTIRIKYERDYNPNEKNEKLNWYLSNGSGVACISIDGYDTNGDAKITLTGSTAGNCYIVFIGSLHDANDTDTIKKLYSTSIEKYESFSDNISALLNNKTVVIAIMSVCLIIIWRVGKKIYDEGVNHKSDFVSKKEYEAFKQETKDRIDEQLRTSEDKILKSTIREIDRSTRPIADVKEIADDMKTKNEIFDLKIEETTKKLDEFKKYGDRIRVLEDNVNRLKYDSPSTDETRRVGR